MRQWFIAGALALFATGAAYAGSYFSPFAAHQAPSSGRQVLRPDRFGIITADQASLQHFLEALPAGPGKRGEISLPLPGGGSRDFYIWQASVMEAPLQARFNGIRTFTAVAKDNPMVTAKLDYTVHGFHAMVFDGTGTYFIDPYTDVADGYYMVYYKKDYSRRNAPMMLCEAGSQELPDAGGGLPERIDGSLPPLALKQNGVTRKSYRLALSCTGEYAQAVGGAIPTTASVLSAMVTSMNRVNGIYERELSVTMVLVSNNDQLVYLDPNSDPFTANNNGNTLLGQNQGNTSSVIGSANYDIGHIFSTGGGGVAFLGCVCRNNSKARGVTGSANPVGDPYDVDYVAHEMGHQFGADHSFNTCSGTENQFSAYEPGSGSTIMAYAGICGPVNNLQSHSDAYFHSVSLDQISDYITNSNGANCPATTAGNTPPAMSFTAATFEIPYQTPFELEAPVAVAETGDTLSYVWEQTDLGDFAEDEDGAGSFTAGPSFRSFLPSSGRVRVFPRIDSLVRNITSYRGERLPQVARTLHFRPVARNIYQGYGAFDIADAELTLNVHNTGTPFRVTKPNVTADSAFSNESYTVSWNVAQTDQAPVSTANVDIFLSLDGGYTYPYTLATAVPNNGSAVVTMPADTYSVRARIKVKGSGNVFFDISDADFVLADSSMILSVNEAIPEQEVQVFPNPATTELYIRNSGNARLSLALYNAVGQEVRSGNVDRSSVIDLAGLARGVYYLKLSDAQRGARLVKRITLK